MIASHRRCLLPVFRPWRSGNELALTTANVNRLPGVAVAILALLGAVPGPVKAQSSPLQGDGTKTSDAQPPAESTDVFDLWRKFRHKEPDPAAVWDYRKPMKAFAPVIGAKPSSGAVFGVAGNVAFYRGDPCDDTHFLGGGQPDVLDQGTDRQSPIASPCSDATTGGAWTAITAFSGPRCETYDLGTSADTHTGVDAEFRLLQAAPHRVLPAAPAPLRRRRSVLRQSHQRRTERGRGDRTGRRHPTCNTARPMICLSTRKRLPARASIFCGTRATVSSTPIAAGSRRSAIERRSTGFLGSDSSWQRVKRGHSKLSQAVARRPAQDRSLGVHRAHRRWHGAVSRSARHRAGHVRTLGARLQRRTDSAVKSWPTPRSSIAER